MILKLYKFYLARRNYFRILFFRPVRNHRSFLLICLSFNRLYGIIVNKIVNGLKGEKMKSIGLRVTSSCIYYAILEEREEGAIIEVLDKLIIPKSLNRPEALTFIRTNFFSIFKEFSIQKLGLKVMESIAMGNGKNEFKIIRLNIEGVLLELSVNSQIESYFEGMNLSMASKLGISSKELKEVCEGKSNILGIEGWESLIKEEREAIITGKLALGVSK